MKAIKIDVEAKKVYEIEISGDLASMYEALKCKCVCHISLANMESLWLDDEGLLNDEPIGAFTIGDYPQILSGNGLILGVDYEGGNASTMFKAEIIEQYVTFEDIADIPDPTFQIIEL